MRSLPPFSILNHLESLTLLKEEPSQYTYICPVCEGKRFTVKKATGAYTCWSGQCNPKDIREKVSPLAEALQRRDSDQNYLIRPYKKGKKTSAKQSSPTKNHSQQGPIRIATLSQPATSSPQPQQSQDNRRGETFITTYQYSPTQFVERIQWRTESKPKGYDKDFRQYHLAETGEEIPNQKDGKIVSHRPAKGGERVYKKGKWDWKPYRFDEAIQAAKDSGANAILLVEGEQAVEHYRQLEIAAITLQGSAWGKHECQRLSEMLKTAELALVVHPDFDRTGEQKAQKVKEACDEAGVLCLIVEPKRIDPNLPEKGDVVDILKGGMDRRDFKAHLEEEIQRAHAQEVPVQNGSITNTSESANPNISFTQQAVNALYSGGHWICVAEVLYEWVGTHYSMVEDASEKQRIQKILNTLAVEDKNGNISYPHANPRKVKEALEWIKMKYAVSAKVVNPTGYLNCTNGVLTFDWTTGLPQSAFTSPHDPSQHYFTCRPVVKFDPDADPIFCNQLLKALDEPQRSIFLKLLAASLDLPEVRRLKGRIVRAALLNGEGNNGKDSLRLAISLIFGGRGITSATLADFKQYDAGKKFALAKLVDSRINWASENSTFVPIDNLEVLKALITGDTIEIENKFERGYETNPDLVLFFNINGVPTIQAGLEAIKSRYTVISFDKIFTPNPDLSKGELRGCLRSLLDRKKAHSVYAAI